MQNRMGRFAVLLALVVIAPSGKNAAVAADIAESDHALTHIGVTSLSFENMQVFRTVETQTSLGRREATEREKQAAIANGRAIYASFTPEKRAKLKKKKIRYIAVATVPTASVSTPLADNTSSSGSGLDLMIFDTSEGTVANKYVYTVKKKPDMGSSIKLDDYNTLFTGL
jgi:hypothetical protein